MIIASNSLYSTGLSAIQAGLSQADGAARQIASQATDFQDQRLRGADRSNQDMATSMVSLVQAQQQVQAGAKVEKATDEALGRLIDTWA
ncbi:MULTISPECIES: flagellar basal body rod C-terminal domain-containing protein [unclassified Pseudomonas]|uniref:flagellar basal body rod C-terminal domain-containing protein n=1 Tax=unclassified Pseudomonas TaxID=196821 RepID=UPI000BC9DB61|nr:MULTISPECIES: flagellar basal body rod C-terminal domain-containing protein [unclassified Pseudomonas]PVZ15692.1 Flagellar basal body rod FlgEFG protein [Pseudomonas sp. URIL14HWK12:I12]PVZ25066.1 Flagellar basal body rod FlgEFG protein [Pseudomonas sp. URIL14HWK12:I10]PVZ34912.1 Flagellar basal body rod FlgEFG protein [Pseudomonas sp. URIL14HWK12:I11]SNZ09644.1 Flagellar basal body rod FlgEFG protein C-terminal [Pseudomonas sp. URIL14HWK12:I9]